MIDTSTLGTTAARCMEELDKMEELDGGQVIASAVVVVAEDENGTMTVTRTFCSEGTHYRQLGLLHAGLEVVESGLRYIPEVEEDE